MIKYTVYERGNIMSNQNQYVVFASSYHETVIKQFFKDNNIGFKQLIGSYKGTMEDSYIINKKYLSTIERAGFLYAEESILLLGESLGQNRRRASLHFLNALKPDQDIGILRAVVKEDAMKEDAWSYRPDLDTYFITA